MFWWFVWQEKHGEVVVYTRLRLLFIRASTLFLANLHSNFECPPIVKVVFPETTKNFCIGVFWNFIMKVWERARKPFKEYRALKEFDQELGVWLCQCVSNCDKHDLVMLTHGIRIFKHQGCYTSLPADGSPLLGDGSRCEAPAPGSGWRWAPHQNSDFIPSVHQNMKWNWSGYKDSRRQYTVIRTTKIDL
jgi:hypothetical protein